ncbi:hypothetical protein D3C76_721150 [compost metagenome]
MHLGWVDLIALQHVLHQGAAGFNHQSAILHAVVGLDDGALFRFQARVGLDDHRQ